MKYHFSTKSEIHLQSCHYDLQMLARGALAMGIIDFAVICGHRGEERQNIAYEDDKSDLKWPNSKHNVLPSNAFDLAPITDGGIPWDNSEYWFFLAGMIMTCAKKLDIKIRWGGDFSFKDLAHFERTKNG